MITYFPEIYPDELLYSLLARYYAKSGCIAYRHIAEDLFLCPAVKPDKELANVYTPNALLRLTQHMPMEAIVEKHTMFPYYGRFLPKERRNKAFRAIVNMEGNNYNNLLMFPKRRNCDKRYLRYCPACAADDREKYGETYWHRVHQLRGNSICPLHGCYLKNSNILISDSVSSMLVSAEEAIPNTDEIEICENEIELRLARYIAAVFQANVDFESDVSAGDFLHSRIRNTKYISAGGKHRHMALFKKDFQEYYKELSNDCLSVWAIQKIMTNRFKSLDEVCMAGMFLDVPVSDLISMKLPGKQLFDEKAYSLREQEMNCSHVAKQPGTSIETAISIGEGKHRTNYNEKKQSNKKGVKPNDWNKMDNELLSQVKAAIKELQGDEEVCPRRVSICAVENMLGLSLRRLPQCKAEVQRHYLSTPEYHAQKIVWASKKVIRDEQLFNMTNLRKKTNLSKSNLIECLPYVTKYANDELCDRLRNLASGFQL